MNFRERVGKFTPIKSGLKKEFAKTASSLKFNRVVILVLLIVLIPFLVFMISSFRVHQVETNVKDVHDYFLSAYVPDELVVKLKDNYTVEDLTNLENVFNKIGVETQEKAFKSDKPYLANYYILKFAEGTNLENAKEALDATGQIEISHPNYIFTVQATSPNDSFYSRQWDLSKIGMPTVWDITRGADNIKVAVIDTGIDYGHDDFVGRQFIRGLNFAYCDKRDRNGFCVNPPTANSQDDHGHGTHVAGTIGAVANNSRGIAGMLFNTTIVGVKTMKNDGKGEMVDNVDGIIDAVNNGAKVINLSLSSGEGKQPCDSVPSLQDTIDDAVSNGVVIVVAAGNDNQDASNESPPSCRGVIVVGATDANDKRWPKSNYGSRVDISAPGEGIISTFPGNRYASNGGTSMAAPHVAAAAALLLSVNPSLSPQAVISCLKNNADPITTDKPIGKRLNVQKAIAACAPNKITPSPTIALPGLNTGSGSSPTPSPTIPPVSQPGITGGTTVNRATPTPVKTYTCKQAKGNTPKGAIQIGNLVCTPN